MLKDKEKIQKFYDDAFDKMFQMVGLEKADKTFMNQPFWYTKHKWSLDQENNFKEWFLDEYRKRFKKNKRYAEDECRWFLFQWGWTSDNTNIKEGVY